MARLRRFADYRFIGLRDSMEVFDCDDGPAFARLEGLVERGDLVRLDLIQTFAPDTTAEAANRGFAPWRP